MQSKAGPVNRADSIARLMEKNMGVGGRDLRTKLRRARRQLPHDIRAAVERLADAADLSAHPKLASRIDSTEIDKDYARASRYLASVDPSARRTTRLMRLGAALAINLLVVFVVLTAILVWRGFL